MDQNLIRKAILGVMPIVRDSGLLISFATFKVPPDLTAGGFVRDNYVDVPGLIDIACMASPLGTGSGFSASETKAQEEQQANQEFHIVLDDFYPAVNDVWRSAGCVVVDGLTLDVTGVEHPSQNQYTRVRAQNVTI